MSVEAMKKAMSLCMEVRQQSSPRMAALAIPLYEELREAIAAAEQAQPVAVVVELNDIGGAYELVSPPKYRPPVGAKIYAIPPDIAALLAERDDEIRQLSEQMDAQANQFARLSKIEEAARSYVRESLINRGQAEFNALKQALEAK